jgi:hypothetical protein
MSNNKQQTAVEWYGIQLEMLFRQYYIGRISITEFHTKRFEFEEQAKEMEKEQMIEFGELCWKNLLRSDVIMRPRDVYNETYGGNK